MPHALTHLDDLKTYLATAPRPLGFVPTMGYLHEGHAALIQAAQKANASVLVSVFVNPTQFNEPADFKHYPRNPEGDIQIAREAGADAVWCPSTEMLYPEGDDFRVHSAIADTVGEGKARPGHFAGVATVLLKMTSLIRPETLYLGEKDFEQVTLTQRLMAAFYLPTEVVCVPTVRSPTGLALSSRNARLSPEEQESASAIHHCLQHSPTVTEIPAQLAKKGIEVEYVRESGRRRFIAARINQVRLIDTCTV